MINQTLFYAILVTTVYGIAVIVRKIPLPQNSIRYFVRLLLYNVIYKH